MLQAIKTFFEQNIAGRGQETPEQTEHRLKLAVAALLTEVLRSDDDFNQEERDHATELLQTHCGLSSQEARQLMALADEEVREALDLYQFTSQINKHFSAEEKVDLIERMWRVALADGVLHRHEDHLIRRVAELLYVKHGDINHAKIRAQNG